MSALKTWSVQEDSAQAIRSGSVSVIRSLLARMKLTPNTLVPQIRVFLSGEVGRELANVAARVSEDLSSLRTAWTVSDLLSELKVRLGDSSSSTELTRQITGGFESSLNQISATCGTTLRQQLVKELDGPFRFAGSQAAIEICDKTLNETLKACEEIYLETQTALTEFCAQEDSDAEVGEVLSFCRQYCCLTIYPAIYQIFSRHIQSIRQTVSLIASDLGAFRDQLGGSVADGPEWAAAEEIHAFGEFLREAEPQLLSELFESLAGTPDTELQATFNAQLRQLALRFLLGGNAGESDHQTQFATAAWPWIRGCGGRHRVSVIVPDGFDTAGLKPALEAEFGKCVSFAALRKSPGLLACCKIHDVSIDGIAAALSVHHPGIPDLASRLHTRIDVDWNDPGSYPF